MRRIIFLGCGFAAAFLLGGLPLVSEQTQRPIPNYRIHADGTFSQFQQSGNTLLSWSECNKRYNQSQLNQLEREQLGLSNRP